jgi:hypothetical protein
MYVAFEGEKSSQKIGFFYNFCTTNSQQSPICRKFAQSGHPDYWNRQSFVSLYINFCGGLRTYPETAAELPDFFLAQKTKTEI